VLVQRVQLQLKKGEKTDKADESPVTVADYGLPAVPVCSVDPCMLFCLHRKQRMHAEVERRSNCENVGAQALVAWSLQRSLPQQAFSMVAEEDSIDLRQVQSMIL